MSRAGDQALEREIRFLRGQIARMREAPGDCPFLACDNSCMCATSRGMATNGGCRCDERKLRMAVQWWRRRAEFLQVTVQDLREGAAPEPSGAPTEYSDTDSEEFG